MQDDKNDITNRPGQSQRRNAIVEDERGQTQPADKETAQRASKQKDKINEADREQVHDGGQKSAQKK